MNGMKNNKKYIFILIGVIILFIIFVGIVFFQQNSEEQAPSSSAQQSQVTVSIKQPFQNNNNGASPSVTLAPPSSSPKLAAQQFYVYYFSSLENPLANGAYKTNPYLSPQFKDIIGAAYKNGNVPVFCPQNKTANIVVDKEESVYYNNGYLMQEVISQAPPGNKDLYTLELQQINGKWFIFDINCIP
jgi:hypothetical protein